MRRFGKYDVVDKIGEGGFGIVYEGYDPQIRRRVAIKTCTSADAQTRRRFFREAEIAGNLHHRNLVVLYDAGEQDGLPYLVQEYLTGEDLDHKIRHADSLSFATKLLYLVQVARGLDHAHQQGVVHRDVNPSNVRVLDDGLVKIIDFGIASSQAEQELSTASGKTVGTAAYLAPEQIWGAPTDHRVDIHAFGVLAYELLTGRRAFGGDDAAADPTTLMQQVLEHKPEPLREHWPECPAALEALVARCLAKDPEHRYQNLTEVVRELEALNLGASPTRIELSASARSGGPGNPAPPAREKNGNGAPSAPVLDRASSVIDPEPRKRASAPEPALDARRELASAPRGIADHPLVGTRRASRPAASSKAASSSPPARRAGSAIGTVVLYVAVLAVMGLLGAAAAFWFQRDGSDAQTPVPTPLSEPAAESEDEDTKRAAADGPSGSDSASAVVGESATLVVKPGWSPDIALSISNQPAVQLDRERRFRLEPGVEHYLELSLVDGDLRMTVPDRIRLEPGEERVLVARMPRPAGLTLTTAPSASRVFVRVDGKALGWTPVANKALAPGRYRVEAWSSSSTRGRPRQSVEVDLRSRRLTVISFDPQKLDQPVVSERDFDPTP